MVPLLLEEEEEEVTEEEGEADLFLREEEELEPVYFVLVAINEMKLFAHSVLESVFV